MANILHLEAQLRISSMGVAALRWLLTLVLLSLWIGFFTPMGFWAMQSLAELLKLLT